LPDPAQQLEAIYLAGFAIETFDRFPNAVGVAKGSCIALVEPTAQGLKIIGQPGWQMGDLLGVLIERSGRKVFQHKGELVDATPERLVELAVFREQLEALISPHA
jgi:hypothetical protein